MKTADVAATIVQVYPKKNGVLLAPGFGVIVRNHGRRFVLTAGHLVEEEESGEIWDRVHPEVAKNLGFESPAKLLWEGSGKAAERYAEGDLMSVPLEEGNGPATEQVEKHAGLLEPAWIACLDYDPEDEVLIKRLDGQAGLVEAEDRFTVRLSCAGQGGMSGAPVFLRSTSEKGELALLGIYLGTPATTPLTRANIESHAKVAKVAGFIG
jgi:hypothetical protein